MALHKDYSSFDQLDGSHPWKQSVPEGYVTYSVRQLPIGRVAYFNFHLAKEMGLIPKDHPHTMSPQLEKKILQTFNLRIINEYDELYQTPFDPKTIKPIRYMATRYLQLQHENKNGKTSGDGRCIWNGYAEHGGRIWDVSSRGTGVTRLAPGAIQAGKPLQSGNTDFGYGCGLADIDELYGAAILSEIFHNHGIETERMLTIIDNGKGNGIGVRAGLNLLRPAHLFIHLRQNNLAALERGLKYFIDRQYRNRVFEFNSEDKNAMNLLLEDSADRFAKFSAHLEREYIFAWLDWDGDNVLMQPGIIDYGSIRQFGLRHDLYRYDDVERWSTNLNEQKIKARQIMQGLIQSVDAVVQQKRRSLESFKDHRLLKRFDKQFEFELRDHFLHQLGFSKTQCEMTHRFFKKKLSDLFDQFQILERKKTSRRLKRVADGINRPAIFNMRRMLFEIPNYYSLQLKSKRLDRKSNLEQLTWMPAEEAFELMLTSHASRKDRELSTATARQIDEFQKRYQDLLFSVLKTQSQLQRDIKGISERSLQANPTEKITGNGLIFVVDEIIKFRKKGLTDKDIQLAMDHLIAQHSPNLEPPQTRFKDIKKAQTLFKRVSSLVTTYADEI